MTLPRVRRCPAFTLIELLVVIAIVAIVISLTVPALSGARATARMTRELAQSQQQMVGFTTYCNDMMDAVPPGYPPAAWVGASGRMAVFDRGGERVFGEVAQRYPFRLLPWMGETFEGLYNPALLRAVASERGDFGGFGVDENYVLSLYPQLGMNVLFVGGSDRQQQFTPAFTRAFGRLHIERLSLAQRPSGVLAFASARGDGQGVEVLRGASGFFRVEPPRFIGPTPRWSEAYDPVSLAPGSNSGFVALRHAGRAVVAHLDGHAASKDWTQLRDMRLWADQATNAEWSR